MIAAFPLLCISVALISRGIDCAEDDTEYKFTFDNSDLQLSGTVYEMVNEKAENYRPSPPIAQGRTEIFNKACGGAHRGQSLGNVVIKCPDGTYISIMKCLKAGTYFGIQHMGHNKYRRVVWTDYKMCA